MGACMSKVDKISDLQQIELNILLDIDQFCKKHNITYYLGEGTLLGAIRHQGFIPWDDDIDILMKREDYEKFLKLAPSKMDADYEIQHSTTIKNYWSPFIKVRYLGKSLYKQQHIKHLTNHNGPCVDIFPLDYVPKQYSRAQYYQSLKIKFLRRTLSLKLGLTKKRSIKNSIMKFIGSFLCVKYIHNKLDKTFKKYKTGKYIANLGSYYSIKKQTFPSDYYDLPRYVSFEGNSLPIPNKAETILSSIYGDYMQLPPEEKRVIKHHYNIDERE
jgi:lipopolysaccharide cholinephosphotransferase